MLLSETLSESLGNSMYPEEMKIPAVEASSNVVKVTAQMSRGISLLILWNESGIVTKSNSTTSGPYFAITKILLTEVLMFSSYDC